MRKHVMWSVGIMAALSLALAACGGGGGGGGGSDVDPTACGGAGLGCISGTITDSSGNAITTGATVTTAGVATATANAQGWYAGSSVAEGDQVICFSATGYATVCRTVSITEATNTPLSATLLPTRGAAVAIPTIENGGVGSDTTTAAQVTFTAGDVCDADGTATTGTINCYFTPVDVTDATVLAAAPLSFQATATDGSVGSMISDAMMELTCENASGDEVNICSSQTADVRIPVYGTCTVGTLAGWRYNTTTGTWSEYDTGNFTSVCGTDETDSYYGGTIDHMTWINGDRLVDDTCLTGFVYTAGTTATSVPVTVKCWGTNANWQNEVQVGSSGRFCIPVPAGYNYACNVSDSTSTLAAADNITGTAPATVVAFPLAACPADDCTDIGGFVFASPILTTTLTWGLNPADLDSHTASNAGVHVWFSDKDIDILEESVSKGSLTSAPYIALDTDDTTSYGPEITTVMPSVTDGKYCFGVHKYSGTGDISQVSTDINGAAKAATVTVQGNGLAQTFTVPSSNPSSYEYWRVYTVEFEGGVVKSGTFTAYNDLVETAETDCNW